MHHFDTLLDTFTENSALALWELTLFNAWREMRDEHYAQEREAQENLIAKHKMILEMAPPSPHGTPVDS